MDFPTILICTGHQIRREFNGVVLTRFVLRRVNFYSQVFVQVENEKKSLPVFAPFGRPVHLELVAKLPIQEGWGQGFADWVG